jgi:hypothetical protein
MYGGGVLVERSDAAAETFAAGFQFARRLREPEFRRVLHRIGWKSGQDVVMTVENEPVVDVISRVVFDDTDARAYIAIQDEHEPREFRFLVARVAQTDAGDVPEAIRLGPEASIGMLYAAVSPCGTYVPTRWPQPLLFERIAATA